MSNYLHYGTAQSEDYGIHIITVNDEDIPSRDYSVYSIPGRSRDLHYDNGRWENIDRVYKCVAFDDGSVRASDKITAFISELMQLSGYQRIEDSMHTEYYKLGEFRGGTAPEYAAGKDGVWFELTFDCDARKYLTSGETATDITNTGSATWKSTYITGQGTVTAKPLFRIGAGSTIIKCQSSANTLTVSGAPAEFYYDAELGDAYSVSGSENYNQYISLDGDFAELSPSASNYLSVKSGATVLIYPRWCKL